MAAGDRRRSTSGASGAPAAYLPELMSRCAVGDEAAFAELYDRTSDRVYGLVLRILRAPELAVEVTQEVYMDAWHGCARFDPRRGSAMAWLCTIAHRRAVDRVRQSESDRARDDRWARDNDVPENDGTWAAAEASLEGQRVRRCLDDLSDIQRQAITLAYFEGHTQVEVAGLLGIPLGTVKSRLRDGLAQLRVALGEER